MNNYYIYDFDSTKSNGLSGLLSTIADSAVKIVGGILSRKKSDKKEERVPEQYTYTSNNDLIRYVLIGAGILMFVLIIERK